MNLNHLAIFHAVAASGSVSRGAQQLHISQSAVSKQLSEFERALGVPLFDRLPRGVRLTEAGRLLVGYANRLFAIEAEARARGWPALHAELARVDPVTAARRLLGARLLGHVEHVPHRVDVVVLSVLDDLEPVQEAARKTTDEALETLQPAGITRSRVRIKRTS